MIAPTEHQVAVADEKGTVAEIAVRFGISLKRVRELRRKVLAYWEWKSASEADALLPFAERRVAFMPLSLRPATALRNEGVKTGADLAALTRKDLLLFVNVGKSGLHEINRYLAENGVGQHV